MRLHQRAGAIEEHGAVGGEPDRPRRALDEALSKQCLEPLKLQADGGLRHAECFGGAGKTLEVGDQQEGLDGGDVECGSHYEWLSLVSI